MKQKLISLCLMPILAFGHFAMDFDEDWAAASGGASYVAATGGVTTNYTENGTNYTAHIFTNSGTLAVSAPGTVEYLVVGGGGGGASGGGGAGGVLTGAVSVTAGNITVTVGVGGLPTFTDSLVNGGNGGDSSFGDITAVGGGGGGQIGDYQSQAPSGGSGGGGGSWASGTMPGGAGTAGQGYGGGDNGYFINPGYPAGGGGGAGGIGGSATGKSLPGIGGPGIVSSIGGTATTYATGGNGGIYFNSPTVQDGAANTGSGGSGAGSLTYGGSGGSGIVIIRYRRN